MTRALLLLAAILALGALWRRHTARVRAWREWDDDTDWLAGDPRLVEPWG